MKIVKAQISDKSSILSLYQKVVAHQIKQNQKQWDETDITWEALTAIYDIDCFYIMKDQEQIVAACIIGDEDPIYWPEVPKQESLYLHKLAVHPAYRKRHLADELITFFKEQGKALNLADVRLDVRAYKTSLRALYERNGFTLVRTATIFDQYDTALYHYQEEDIHA